MVFVLKSSIWQGWFGWSPHLSQLQSCVLGASCSSALLLLSHGQHTEQQWPSNCAWMFMKPEITGGSIISRKSRKQSRELRPHSCYKGGSNSYMNKLIFSDQNLLEAIKYHITHGSFAHSKGERKIPEAAKLVVIS